jgi:hypothetical protein
MIILIIVNFLASSLEIHYKVKPESYYFGTSIDRIEPNDHHPHSPEEEMISIFEIVGTYYEEVIGAEFIYTDVSIEG